MSTAPPLSPPGPTQPVLALPGAAGHQPASPAAADPASRCGSLSPSRATDFMACPLLYRFRTIDRLPERPSLPAARGTVVHAVLEALFRLPAAERSPAAAAAMVEPVCREALAADPELAAVLAGPAGMPVDDWVRSAHHLLDGYFALEDPRRLHPRATECLVEATLPSGLRLRGYVDRLDVAPAGDLRVVDYKTGSAPHPEWEARAMFQLKFYAVVIRRSQGVLPRSLQLMYLGDREVLRYQPDDADVTATERKLDALWGAIARAIRTGDWRPRPSRLCEFCDHRAICPAWGGTPPPLPEGRGQQEVDGQLPLASPSGPASLGSAAAGRQLRRQA